MKYFLDTNVFDYLLLNDIDINRIQLKGEYFTSNIQKSEIKNIKDVERRNNLLNLYESLKQEKLLLKSGMWLDDLYWDDEQPWIDEIGKITLELIGNSTNKPWKDALLGEITKVNSLFIVTNDKNFAKRAKSNSINTLSIGEFLSEIT